MLACPSSIAFWRRPLVGNLNWLNPKGFNHFRCFIKNHMEAFLAPLTLYSGSYIINRTLHVIVSVRFCRDLFRHLRTSITSTAKIRPKVLPFSKRSLSPFAFTPVLVPLLAPISSKLVKTFSYWESTALIAFPLTVHWVGHSGFSEADGPSPEAAAITEKMALNFPESLLYVPNSCTHCKALHIKGLNSHADCYQVNTVCPTMHIQCQWLLSFHFCLYS